jgi:hypothetical protein
MSQHPHLQEKPKSADVHHQTNANTSEKNEPRPASLRPAGPGAESYAGELTEADRIFLDYLARVAVRLYLGRLTRAEVRGT